MVLWRPVELVPFVAGFQLGSLRTNQLRYRQNLGSDIGSITTWTSCRSMIYIGGNTQNDSSTDSSVQSASRSLGR